jgi:hypothetical protein
MADTPTSGHVDFTSSGTNTGAYAINEVVGSIWSASGFALTNGGHGFFTGFTMIDLSIVFGSASIYVWDTTISQTDATAFAPSDAEMLTYQTRIDLPSLTTLTSNRESSTSGFWPYHCAAGSTSLYFTVVTRNAFTNFTATSDLRLKLFYTALN